MNKDYKPNQAYLWSNGVYHTQPESISTQGHANLIELKQKRIAELEAQNRRLRNEITTLSCMGSIEEMMHYLSQQDCDTCHGLGYVDLFAGDVMPNGNEWRGAGPHRIDCPDCQSEGGADAV